MYLIIAVTFNNNFPNLKCWYIETESQAKALPNSSSAVTGRACAMLHFMNCKFIFFNLSVYRPFCKSCSYWSPHEDRLAIASFFVIGHIIFSYHCHFGLDCAYLLECSDVAIKITPLTCDYKLNDEAMDHLSD